MLDLLHIENIAIIEQADISFRPGFNVLTGETGAGKSILIDSINAILGNRTSKDLVRTGASKAVIRAAFEQVPDAVLNSLEKAGYERSDALMLSREITAEGKSTCRINGMPATASVLRELCGGLININGQHDSVGLLNPARHLGILDDYAQNDAEFQEYYVLYRELVRIKRELDAMITDEAEKAEKNRSAELSGAGDRRCRPDGRGGADAGKPPQSAGKCFHHPRPYRTVLCVALRRRRGPGSC